MDGNQNFNIPDWVPDEIKLYVLDIRDKTEPNKVEKFLTWPEDGGEALRQEWLTDLEKRLEIENRILCDPRMKKFWKRFDVFPNLEKQIKITRFFSLAVSLPFNGLDRAIAQKERERIKNRKKTLKNKVLRLTKSAEAHRGVELDIRIAAVRDELKQLDYYKRSYNPPICLFNYNFKILSTAKRQASPDYVEFFTRMGLAILLKEIFGKNLYHEAAIISLVLAGKPTPPVKDLKGLHDSVRIPLNDLVRRTPKTKSTPNLTITSKRSLR